MENVHSLGPTCGEWNPKQDKSRTLDGAPRKVLRPSRTPPPTHRSPISRMLLRWRWQSCSTCGTREEEASPARAGSPQRHPPHPMLAGPPRAGKDGPSKGHCSASLECRPVQAAADGGPRRPEPRPPPPRDQRAVATHIRVSVSEHLVEDVAELPAEDGATGERQTNGVGPEGEGPLLMVSAQNDACQG